MDAALQSRTEDSEPTALAVVPPAPSSDRVVEFSSSMKDKLLQTAAEGGSKRDWSSALDLVSEAFEAIRMADERAAASEEYQAELVQRHADHVKVLETRIAAADKRADAAENRAKTAEGWLSKFHDTIIDEFQRTFASRGGAR
ncbi:hypothetical protein D3273_09550 [Lichenibacterium minor]|jgi:hypothetical protein|uniref:Uncharacterized protein n=1 Tax=Lichenibacterium minor TaxID=2316528 RepID=A0A4V1RUT4_9HYPH|nr:hypothetical protein [Lichenibacterium minor]RYC32264.1 hypothetical protein D3273_09550 [Lichenibacterium minor]